MAEQRSDSQRCRDELCEDGPHGMEEQAAGGGPEIFAGEEEGHRGEEELSHSPDHVHLPDPLDDDTVLNSIWDYPPLSHSESGNSFSHAQCSSRAEKNGLGEEDESESSSSSVSSESASNSSLDKEDSSTVNSSRGVLDSSANYSVYSSPDSHSDSSESASEQSDASSTAESVPGRIEITECEERVDPDDLEAEQVLVYLENNGSTLVVAAGTGSYTEYMKMSAEFAWELLIEADAEERGGHWDWHRLLMLDGRTIEGEEDSTDAMRGGVGGDEERHEEEEVRRRWKSREWFRAQRVDTRGKVWLRKPKRNGTRTKRIDR